MLDATLTQGVAAADATAGLLARVADDGEHLEVIASRGYDDRSVESGERWHRFPLDAAVPLSEAVRTLRPVFINSKAERDERYPVLSDVAPEDSHALACLPLALEGEAIGGIAFSFARDGVLDESRRSLKVAIANQVAQALGRARLLEVCGGRARARRRSWPRRRRSCSVVARLRADAPPARAAGGAAAGRLVLASTCAARTGRSSGLRSRTRIRRRWPGRRSSRSASRRTRTSRAGAANVLRTGEPEFLPEIPQELLDHAIAQNPELGRGDRASWACARGSACRCRAHGVVLGALSLVAAESGRLVHRRPTSSWPPSSPTGPPIAVENARLFRESERRARRRARTRVHGRRRRARRPRRPRALLERGRCADHRGGGRGRRRAARSPTSSRRWEDDRPARRDRARRARRRARRRFPMPRADGERWVSVTAVEFGEGRVYALRDVTAERALEQARSDFVATASHELRTPIAAVYGAVRTLRRPDVEFSDEDKEMFLQIIETEGDRLGNLVEQILVAGQIDAGTVRLAERPFDVVALADERRRRGAAARARRPRAACSTRTDGVPPRHVRRGQAPPGARQPRRERRQVLARRRPCRRLGRRRRTATGGSSCATRGSASRRTSRRASSRSSSGSTRR